MMIFNPQQPYQLIIKKQGNDGRYIYRILQSEKAFYLKYQISNISMQSDIRWENEKSVYKALSQKTVCFPQQWLSLSHFCELKSNEIAMILPQGQPLFTAIKKDAVELISQVLQCLKQFYITGWIHGDLKKNHFLWYRNKIRLIDFEHAQQPAQSYSNLDATPRYMAPELFHHQPKTLQSDLYALGVILYEWLTEKPLQAKTYHDWAKLHCQDLSVELSETYFYLQPFIKKLLHKQQTRRFSSIDEAIGMLHLLTSSDKLLF